MDKNLYSLGPERASSPCGEPKPLLRPWCTIMVFINYVLLNNNLIGASV